MSDIEYGLPFRIGAVERRLDRLEALEPAVVADRVAALSDDVKSLRRAFYTFAFAVVGSSILFAFTVFSLLGHHP